MINTNKKLYYSGNIKDIQQTLNIFIIELDKNKDIANILDEKFNVIWYVQEINNNNGDNKYIKIARVSRGNIYITKNTCIQESMYYLMKNSDVIVVGMITKIKEALNIIDMGLTMGKEIICIKNSSFLADKLIKEGANCV